MGIYNRGERASVIKAASAGLAAYGMSIYNALAVRFDYTEDTPIADNFLAGEVEISTLTFEALVDMVESEYVVIYDTVGLGWAIAGSKQGIAEITTITAVADVSDSLDGKYWLAQDVAGSVAFWIDTNNSGTTIPAGAAAADRAVEITTIATDDTDVTIGGLLRTAVGADSKFTTAGAGADCIVTQVDLKALTDMADGDTGFGFVTDTQGSDLATPPTGAIWAAIPAGRKAQVDLVAETTDIEVAAAFEVAFDALASVPFATDDTAADGTMLFTQTLRGPATTPVSNLEDDASAGGVGIAETNPGIASTVDVTANTITLTAHDFVVGLKGQASTTGTLPAGLSLATDYFIIVVDANTIKLATSLANAVAGTAIDITDQGDDGDTHTFTPTALAGGDIKLQESVDGITWTDIASANDAIAGTGSSLIQVSSKTGHIRGFLTLTAGRLIISSNFNQKG